MFLSDRLDVAILSFLVGIAIIFTLYLVVFVQARLRRRGLVLSDGQRKALFCIMFAFGAGSAAIFAQDANKAKIAAYDVFAVIDRESACSDGLSPTASRPRGLRRVPAHASATRRAPSSSSTAERLVPDGTSCAFVGPSGSGKSTTFSSSALLRADAGAVTVGGTPPASMSPSCADVRLRRPGARPLRRASRTTSATAHPARRLAAR